MDAIASFLEHLRATIRAMPNFEVFTKRMVPLVKQPFVTIQTRGIFSLNQSAFQAMGAPDAVELLYDRSARVIGLRPVPTTENHAYGVRGTNNGSSHVIAGTAFVRFYDIDTSVSRRWDAYIEDGVLCIDLNGNPTDVSSNRTGSRKRDAAVSSPTGLPMDRTS